MTPLGYQDKSMVSRRQMSLKELEFNLTIFLGSVPVENNLKDLLATGVQVSNPVVLQGRQEAMRHS